MGIQDLLSNPNIDDPAHPIAYKIFKSNKNEYNAKVRQCVAQNAADLVL